MLQVLRIIHRGRWRGFRSAPLVPNKLLGLSVLLVDDDPMSVRLLRAALSAEGCSLDAAASGKEALEKILECRPDLVVLDLILPDFAGLDLIRTLKADEATRDIVIVVVTTRNGPTTEAAVLQAGASAYVRKPIDPLVLPGTLARHAAR